jgi:GxxExxY protein
MFENEGYALMGAVFEVYNAIGYGLAEEVYQECLEIEHTVRGIPFIAKHELRLLYKGRQIEKRYVPDLYVASCLIVELKAVKELISDHEAQLFNYMRLARQPVGYLINFGSKDKVGWKRFIISDLHRSPFTICNDRPLTQR